MVFLVDETCIKWFFLKNGIIFPPKFIVTAQIHVKLILTHIILDNIVQQPILGLTGF